MKINETTSNSKAVSIKQLLVVDDDSRIRELLRQYLIDHDYYIVTAINAQDAALCMKIFSFDLIIILLISRKKFK